MPRRSTSPTKLDAIDIKILMILQRDNRTSQQMIGQQVHLSAPAVQRRIKRLEEVGVLRGNVAIVDPEAAGHWLTIIVNVEFESERLDENNAAKAAFIAEPAVQQCYNVTGEIDYVLIVVVRTMRDFTQFMERALFGNPNVKRFHTFVAVDCVKVGLLVPLT